MVHDIQYGEVRGKFSRVDRAKSPITFWVNIAVHFVLGFSFYGGATSSANNFLLFVSFLVAADALISIYRVTPAS